MLLCKKCNSQISEKSVICPICNSPVENNVCCPFCGKEYDGKPYFCNSCGKPLFIGNISNHLPSKYSHSFKKNDKSSAEPIEESSEQKGIVDELGSRNEVIKSNSNKVYSDEKIYVEDDDVDVDAHNNKSPKSSKWLHFSLIIFFLIIIGAGIILFLMYDKKFEAQQTEKMKFISDSIKNKKHALLNRGIKEQEIEDSIRNDELKQIQYEDSLERVRKHEEWRKDSVEIDAKMTQLVNQMSPSNKILAKYQDYNTCVCYYTDTINPIFKLTCFDGKANEIANVLIDNIQCKLVSSYLTPDNKSFIILCKDNIHDYGMAYKINMFDNTFQDYKSMDEDGNKCFDVGKTSDGFYMKFGRGSDRSFKNLYIINYDKYGNYLDKE